MHTVAQAAEARAVVAHGTGAGADVVVATPGRLTAHLRGTPGFDLAALRFLVVDETDRLLRQACCASSPLPLMAICGFYSIHDDRHDTVRSATKPGVCDEAEGGNASTATWAVPCNLHWREQCVANVEGTGRDSKVLMFLCSGLPRLAPCCVGSHQFGEKRVWRSSIMVCSEPAEHIVLSVACQHRMQWRLKGSRMGFHKLNIGSRLLSR